MDESILGILVVTAAIAVTLGLILAAPPGVQVAEPHPHAEVENPARLVLLGLPDGSRVGVRLRDGLGRILGEVELEFRGGRAEGLLYFDLTTVGEGTVEVFSLVDGWILSRQPVRFGETRGIWIKVFLFDREGKAFPVVRRIPMTPRVATEALRALLAGPTLIEERAGIWTAAPAGTRLRALTISDGVARATFEVPDPLAPALELFSVQVRETLMQFPTIAAVEIEYVPR
ncbi:GerMN domain-containing protein [Candidatus Bipolaricaulota sp. J31]